MSGGLGAWSFELEIGENKKSHCFGKGVYAECEIAWIIYRTLNWHMHNQGMR